MEYNSLSNQSKNNILNDANFLGILKSKFQLKEPSVLKNSDTHHQLIELLSIVEKKIK